jgi:hypothetical protein
VAGYDQLDYFLGKHNDTASHVLVYNSKTNKVRNVLITPSSSWGGKGR